MEGAESNVNAGLTYPILFVPENPVISNKNLEGIGFR